MVTGFDSGAIISAEVIDKQNDSGQLETGGRPGGGVMATDRSQPDVVPWTLETLGVETCPDRDVMDLEISTTESSMITTK